MIRVIIFEDKKSYSDSLKDFFEFSKDIYIAAILPNANEAVKEVKKYKPDVVLMDIQMPRVSGIDALIEIKKILPDTKIMLLTSFDNNDKIFAAICAGASGYVLKNAHPEDLERGIRDVFEGAGFMTPSVAAKVMQMFQHAVVKQQPHYADLTKRQKEVLKYLVDGLSYKMIADKLFITPETVNDHLKAVYKKLHVNSAPEAVREALIRHLI